MKTYIANYIERMKPSFIINLIDRDDGNKKKQSLEKIPRESCILSTNAEICGMANRCMGRKRQLY